MKTNREASSTALRAKSHMPETLFYEKIVPALLILMGVIMLFLILFAFAVIFGYVSL